MALEQIHLNKKGCSGRGVRYRPLSISQMDKNELAAAKDLDEGFTQTEYSAKVLQFGLQDMIVSVTDPGLKTLDGATWHKLDTQTLAVTWETYFTTRDTSILRRIYNTEHGCSQVEVEEIMSGKVQVLEE